MLSSPIGSNQCGVKQCSAYLEIEQCWVGGDCSQIVLPLAGTSDLNVVGMTSCSADPGQRLSKATARTEGDRDEQVAILVGAVHCEVDHTALHTLLP